MTKHVLDTPQKLLSALALMGGLPYLPTRKLNSHSIPKLRPCLNCGEPKRHNNAFCSAKCAKLHKLIGKCLPCLFALPQTDEVLARMSIVGNARSSAKVDNSCECGQPYTYETRSVEEILNEETEDQGETWPGMEDSAGSD